MMDLHWNSSLLHILNLDDVEGTGVYVFSTIGDDSKVVDIGSGVLAERISAHQNTLQSQHKYLVVAWAEAPEHLRGNIERHLADKYMSNDMKQEKGFPDVSPIAVTPPFDHLRDSAYLKRDVKFLES